MRMVRSECAGRTRGNISDGCMPSAALKIQIEMSFGSAAAQPRRSVQKHKADSETVLNRPLPLWHAGGLQALAAPRLSPLAHGGVFRRAACIDREARMMRVHGVPLLR